MPTTYQKSNYNHCAGFLLHHTAGYAANESTLDYPHTTIRPMLIYFHRGTGSIKIEGNHYIISEGDAVILNPGELFHCTIDDHVYHERIVLYFYESVFHALPYDTSNLFDPFYNRKKGVGNLISAAITNDAKLSKTLIQLLAQMQHQDSQSQLLCFSCALEALVSLNKIVIPTTPQLTSKTHIDAILAYINEHYTENINLKQIAADFGINQSYLSHLFKDRVGMSLWNYVILRRLHHFNNLLQQDHNCEQACYDVGFQNYSNFFRLYKTHMGVTPMQYKKQIQK